MRSRGLRTFALLAFTLTLVSCSSSIGRTGAPGQSSGPPRRDVLVTIGSAATFGEGLSNPLSDSWPQRLYHEAFGRSTVLVNAAERAATVDRARGQQLSLAREVHATVAAVWLGDAEVEARVPVESFEAALDGLVEELRDSGSRVLLGNISRARTGAAVYDDAITRVARSRGATLVDVAGALSATPEVGPGSRVDPATSGKIAAAFAAAFARS